MNHSFSNTPRVLGMLSPPSPAMLVDIVIVTIHGTVLPTHIMLVRSTLLDWRLNYPIVWYIYIFLFRLSTADQLQQIAHVWNVRWMKRFFSLDTPSEPITCHSIKINESWFKVYTKWVFKRITLANNSICAIHTLPLN